MPSWNGIFNWILRQNGSYLFQHSKRNAPVQFPQSGLIAVVSKYRLSFRISQPFIFGMFMRQLQKSVRYSHRKCVLRNDETFFTPYCFCVLETIGWYAAAGVELEKVTCLRNPGFFKGFPFCRLNDWDILLFSSACYELFYPQLGVKLCSMAGGGVQKIYMVFFKRTVPAGQVRQWPVPPPGWVWD